MPRSDLQNNTSASPLTAFTTWLKHRWAVYISDIENHVTVLRAETIEPANGSPFMRWAVSSTGKAMKANQRAPIAGGTRVKRGAR